MPEEEEEEVCCLRRNGGIRSTASRWAGARRKKSACVLRKTVEKGMEYTDTVEMHRNSNRHGSSALERDGSSRDGIVLGARRNSFVLQERYLLVANHLNGHTPLTPQFNNSW